MSEERYRVVLSGAIQEGYELPQIQEAFAHLFNIPTKKAKAFLRADNAVVKNDIPEADALQLASQLERIGIIPDVLSLSDNFEEPYDWDLHIFSIASESEPPTNGDRLTEEDEYVELDSFALVEPDLSKKEMEKEMAWLLDDIEPEILQDHARPEPEPEPESQASEESVCESSADVGISVLEEMGSLVDTDDRGEDDVFAEAALDDGSEFTDGECEKESELALEAEREESFHSDELVATSFAGADPYPDQEQTQAQDENQDESQSEYQDRGDNDVTQEGNFFTSDNDMNRECDGDVNESDGGGVSPDVVQPAPFFHKPVVVASALHGDVDDPEAQERGEECLSEERIAGEFSQGSKTSHEGDVEGENFYPHKKGERYPFSFLGDSSEYFRLWIVNFLLSVFSAGIYSAWASVSNKQYLFRNTRLYGSPFAYLANPVVILQGRLLVLMGAIAFVALTGQSVAFDIVLLTIVVLFIPFAIKKSIQYRASVTMWRGLRFGFDGSVFGAYKAFFLWPLAALVSLGFLIPLARYKQIEYVVCNSQYGDARFEMRPFMKDYFLMFLRAMGFVLIGGLLSYSVIHFLSASLGSFLLMAVYFGGFVYYSVRAVNMMFNNISLCDGEVTFEADYQDVAFAEKFLLNALFTFFSLGLYYPWATIHRLEYQTEHLALLSSRDISEIEVSESPTFAEQVDAPKALVPLEKLINSVLFFVKGKLKSSGK